MARLLHIDSSSRTEDSHSRSLGEYAQQQWLARHPGGSVLRRDLVTQPVPHITNATIAGFYTPDEQLTPELRAATAQSDELIGELQAATALLLTLPMYNFGVPSALKAYIDHVVRTGKTFAYEASGLRGLLTAKQALVICASGLGGYAVDEPRTGLDFVEPYLRAVLSFLGIADIRVLKIEPTGGAPESVASETAAARARVQELFASGAMP